MSRIELSSVPPAVWAAATVAAIVLWAVATALLVVIGDHVVPPVDTGGAWVTWFLAAVAAAVAGYLTAVLVIARTRHLADPSVTGFLVGVAIAAVGLTADTILVGSHGAGYPNVATDRAHTILVGLLVGHAAAMAGGIAAGQRIAARSDG